MGPNLKVAAFLGCYITKKVLRRFARHLGLPGASVFAGELDNKGNILSFFQMEHVLKFVSTKLPSIATTTDAADASHGGCSLSEWTLRKIAEEAALEAILVKQPGLHKRASASAHSTAVSNLRSTLGASTPDELIQEVAAAAADEAGHSLLEHLGARLDPSTSGAAADKLIHQVADATAEEAGQSLLERLGVHLSMSERADVSGALLNSSVQAAAEAMQTAAGEMVEQAREAAMRKLKNVAKETQTPLEELQIERLAEYAANGAWADISDWTTADSAIVVNNEILGTPPTLQRNQWENEALESARRQRNRMWRG